MTPTAKATDSRYSSSNDIILSRNDTFPSANGIMGPVAMALPGISLSFHRKPPLTTRKTRRL